MASIWLATLALAEIESPALRTMGVPESGWLVACAATEIPRNMKTPVVDPLFVTVRSTVADDEVLVLQNVRPRMRAVLAVPSVASVIVLVEVRLLAMSVKASAMCHPKKYEVAENDAAGPEVVDEEDVEFVYESQTSSAKVVPCAVIPTT